MVLLIRSHWKALNQLLTSHNVIIEWKLHNNQHWREETTLLANSGSRREFQKFSKERNRIIPSFNTSTDAPPYENVAFTQLDPTMLSTESLYLKYENACILQIPMEHIGILCMLCPTAKKIKYKQVKKIRGIFNMVLDNLLKNADNTLWWKKWLLLARVLLTPLASNVHYSFQEQCQWVLSDNWENFRLSTFRCRGVYKGGNNIKKHTRNKIKRSKDLIRDGEISRAYQALQSDFSDVMHSLPEIQEKFISLLPRKNQNSTDLPLLPPRPNINERDYNSLALNPDDVKRVIMALKMVLRICKPLL